MIEAGPAAGEAGRDLAVASLRGLEAFLALESDWRALFERTRTRNPFLTWEWASEWCRSFGADQLVTVVVRGPSDTVAIAPFFARARRLLPRLHVRRLQLFGSSHLFEMSEVLVDPMHAQVALQLLLRHLCVNELWHWVELSVWSGGTRSWLGLLEEGRPGVRIVRREEVPAPFMRLDSSWEALRRRLRRNVKESIRHSYNSLQTVGHDFLYREHRASAGLDALLDDLFRLHRARAGVRGHNRHPDNFATPEMCGFMRRVAHALADAGHLNLGVLEVGGRPAAVRFNVEVNGALYLYRSGFDPDLWRYGVMTLLVTEGIKSAIGRGLEVVDFSIGMDQAKERWDVSLESLTRFVLVRDEPYSRLLYGLWSAVGPVARRWRWAIAEMGFGPRAHGRPDER
jgi:CelD/BcsL family acetyltransferase involved in cellulose biosynthesis